VAFFSVGTLFLAHQRCCRIHSAPVTILDSLLSMVARCGSVLGPDRPVLVVRVSLLAGWQAGWLAGADGGLQRSLSNILVLGWVSFWRMEWIWFGHLLRESISETAQRSAATTCQDNLPSFPLPFLLVILIHKSPPPSLQLHRHLRIPSTTTTPSGINNCTLLRTCAT
jgi:hypothetical protein